MANFPIPTPPPKSPYAKPDVPYVYQPYPRHVKSIHAKDAKGNPRVVTVHSAEEEAYHSGAEPQIIEHANEAHIEEVAPVYVPKPYPRWVSSTILGKRLIVQNSVEEEYHTGVLMNEDGTPAGDDSEPAEPLQTGALPVALASPARDKEPTEPVQSGAVVSPSDDKGWE